jgi:Domain of unknown function (DUF2017)
VRRRPLQPLDDGAYRLELADEERQAVQRLCVELRALITAEDDAVARLFPAAYRDDPEASAEFDRLARSDLVSERIAALDTVRATVVADRLDVEQVAAWCGALNDARLVLGERLGVTEDLYTDGIDRRDPRAPELALYGWLTWLQGEIVEVLASRL